MKSQRDEILSKIKYDESNESENMCPKHEDRVTHFFCSKHRTIFCRECIKIDHTDESCFVVDLYEIQKMKQIYVKNMISNDNQIKTSNEKGKSNQ